jgi:hypothetical protein
MQTKGYTTSNIGHSSLDRRWRTALAHPSGVTTGDLVAPLHGRVAHQSMAARALRCTKHDGERGKTERGSRGCSPRAANGSAGGGAAPPGSGDGGGSMRWSSNSKKTTGSFAVMSSSSSRLQLGRAAVNWWRTMAARVQCALRLAARNLSSIVRYNRGF